MVIWKGWFETVPCPSFPCFFEISLFFPLRGFLVFLSAFPFFSRDFRGSMGRKSLFFLGGFPCHFSKKKTRKRRTGFLAERLWPPLFQPFVQECLEHGLQITVCECSGANSVVVIWKGWFETVPCKAALNTPFAALCPRILGTRFTDYGLRVSRLTVCLFYLRWGNHKQRRPPDFRGGGAYAKKTNLISGGGGNRKYKRPNQFFTISKKRPTKFEPRLKKDQANWP